MAAEGPVFNVPALPRHLRRAPPRSQVQPPLPAIGYDMRSLRRQAESLSAAAEGLAEEQGALYRQSAELWRYLLALREAHAKNGELLRTQLQSLRDELSALDKRRRQLRERLVAAQTAGEELERVSAQREQAEAEALNERELLLQAEEALRHAEESRELLVARLEEERRRLGEQRAVVLELAAECAEDEQLDKAEAFFRRSQSVLRVEFRRLRRVLAEGVRRSRAAKRALALRQRALVRHCWTAWRALIFRSRVKRRNAFSRSIETKVVVLSRWRVFVALEKLFKRARRRLLQRKGWGILLANLEDRRLDRRAEELRLSLERRRRLRRSFVAWKSDCSFLGWSSANTRRLEKLAIRHFALKLLAVWRQTAALLKKADLELGHRISLSLLSGFLRSWKNLFEFRSRCKNRLKRRFFENITFMMERSRKLFLLSQNAMLQCIQLKKLAAIRKWRRFLMRFRVRDDRENRIRKCTASVSSKQKRRGFLMLIYFAALRKRLTCAYGVALERRAQCALRIWRVRSAQKARSRGMMRRLRLRDSFEVWRSFVPTQHRLRQISTVTWRMHSTCENRRLSCLLRRWQRHMQRIRAVRLREATIKGRFRRLELSKLLGSWKCALAKALFWRGKEMELEHARSKALFLLKTEQLDYLGGERERMLRIGREMVQALSELQNSSMTLTKDVDSLRLKINEMRAFKQALEVSIDDMAEDHRRINNERKRLNSLELVLDQERRRDELAMARRKEQAEQIVKKLQKESATLQEEILQARDQSYLIEKSAIHDVNRDMNVLSQTKAANLQVQGLLRGRREYLEELERSLGGLKDDVSRIRSRIHETSKEGAVILEESEREVRQRSLQLNDLRIRRSRAKARVNALREIVCEKREAMEAAHLQRILVEEARYVFLVFRSMNHLIHFTEKCLNYGMLLTR